MIVLLCLALMAVILAAGWGLLSAGLRAGDRPGEIGLAAVVPAPDGTTVCFAAHNPGGQAVLIGASVRRRGWRLRCEGGRFVSVPRRTSRGNLAARRHMVICAIAAGETQTVIVPVPEWMPRRAELVIAVGEADRLRIIHRAIGLQRPARPEVRYGAPGAPGRDHYGAPGSPAGTVNGHVSGSG